MNNTLPETNINKITLQSNMNIPNFIQPHCEENKEREVDIDILNEDYQLDDLGVNNENPERPMKNNPISTDKIFIDESLGTIKEEEAVTDPRENSQKPKNDRNEQIVIGNGKDEPFKKNTSSTSSLNKAKVQNDNLQNDNQNSEKDKDKGNAGNTIEKKGTKTSENGNPRQMPKSQNSKGTSCKCLLL